MATKSFKVIIVGGSVTGLSVANMLEKFDIDYILLEAYPTIAPQVGASIGMLPNGLRILDQLGCYDPLLEIVGNNTTQSTTRDWNGNVLSRIIALDRILESKVGYRSFFLDRQSLLKVLYNNIKHKEKVLTKKRVKKITMDASGVTVTAVDGSSFFGDVVVGGDGIHSAVRQEMWRIANELDPGYFPSNESSSELPSPPIRLFEESMKKAELTTIFFANWNVRTEVSVFTKCIFGISSRPKTWPPLSQANVLGNQTSHLIVPGPADSLYFFLFVSVGETRRGAKIPRYTEEDEVNLAEEHRNDLVHENGTVFGDIYDSRRISTLVPLEEHVFAKWHFRRVITIGDSAHKIDPITGQGGNGAIEAAALFVNSLNDLLLRHSASDIIKEDELDAALAEVHAKRYKRAETLIWQAHLFQKIMTQQVPFAKQLLWILNKALGKDLIIGRMVELSLPAPHIHGLPIPGHRKRSVPFSDELPAPVIVSAKPKYATTALVVIFFGSLAFSSQHRLHFQFTSTEIAPEILRWTTLRTVASVVPTTLIWTVEGYRLNNRRSLLRFPSLFLIPLAMGVANLETIYPVYYLASALTSYNTLYGRAVPVAYAHCVLPAISLGYILPTLCQWYAGIRHNESSHRLVSEVAPAISVLLAKSLSTIYIWLKSRHTDSTNLQSKERADLEVENELALCTKAEVPPLYISYLLTFGTSALLHVGSIMMSGSTRPHNLSSYIVKSLLGTGRSGIISSASLIAHLAYTTWDMRTLGYITSTDALKSVLMASASTVFLGFGATYSAFWGWRENRLASLARP